MREHVRKGVRAAAVARREARFRAWAARADWLLRRHGSRLVLDVDEAPTFFAPPVLEPIPQARAAAGAAPRVLTLRLGRGVHLGDRAAIEFRPDGANLLELGDGTHLQDRVRFILAGGRIAVGPRTRVRAGAILKSSGDLLIGDQVVIGYGSMLHCHERVELHDLVGLAERCSIIDSTHAIDGSDTWFFEQPITVAPVVLERNVLLSANVLVAAGAHLERNLQVGGGALVLAGRHPGGWLLAGNPARPVRPLGPGARPWTPEEPRRAPDKRVVAPRSAVA